MGNVRFWRLKLLGGLAALTVLSLILFARAGDVAGSFFIRTAVAREGVLETAYVGSGFVVRSEKVVMSPADGVLTLLVEDAQRVRAGQILAEIQQEAPADVQSKVAEIDIKIASLDQKAQIEAENIRRRLDEISARIRATEAELESAITAGRGDLAREYGRTLQELDGQLKQVEDEFARVRADIEAQRRGLVDERQALLRQASERAVRVVADGPGVISLAFDELEGRFAPGQASEALWQAVSAKPHVRRLTDGSTVAKGDPLFRLVESFVMHVFVSFSEPPQLARDARVWLQWPGEKAPGVRARVESIHNRVDAVGVWFSIETYQERFGQLRVLPEVKVITRRVEGVVVPRSSIVVRNGRTGIYLISEGTPLFRYVTVQAADHSLAVVDQVPSGTRIVTNPLRLARDGEPY